MKAAKEMKFYKITSSGHIPELNCPEVLMTENYRYTVTKMHPDSGKPEVHYTDKRPSPSSRVWGRGFCVWDNEENRLA